MTSIGVAQASARAHGQIVEKEDEKYVILFEGGNYFFIVIYLLWLICTQNIYSISLETVTDPRLHISALAVILPSVPSIKSMSVPDYLRTSAVIIQAGV